jgi:hypothetical protein
MVSVGFPDPIAADFGDVRKQPLGLPQPALGFPEFGHIAADEEMLPFRLGPDSGPVQGHDAAQFVDVAALEVAGFPAAPRLAHFLPHAVQVFRIEKNRGDLPHHFIREVAEDRVRTGTDPDDQAALVDDEDQVERGFEDSLIDCIGALAASAIDGRSGRT